MIFEIQQRTPLKLISILCYLFDIYVFMYYCVWVFIFSSLSFFSFWSQDQNWRQIQQKNARMMFSSRPVKVSAKMFQHCIDCKNVEIRYSVELFSFEENARLSRKFVGTDIFQCHCNHMQNFAVSYTNNANNNLLGETFFHNIAAKCNTSLSTIPMMSATKKL